MSPREIADRADAAGFPSVSQALRAWEREPRPELADTLRALADVHALAAIRFPHDTRPHRKIADAFRRAAALLLSEAA